VDSDGDNSTTWDGMEVTINKTVDYQVIHFWFGRSKYLTLHAWIPTQISTELTSLSTQPFVLFMGFLLQYLMRPSEELREYYDNYRQRVEFKHPIVGIHVRRTDKLIREAKYYSLDQYMSYVDRYYNNTDVMNGNTSERLVYLATDEPNVWLNEIKPYIGKGFIFKGDMNATIKSYNKNPGMMFVARYSASSIRNIITQILILSECDYIVCTLSSSVCRLVFPLMISRVNNSIHNTNAIHSLDWGYILIHFQNDNGPRYFSSFV